jgi:hypothetical protein
MTPERGSFEKGRSEFIKMMADPKYCVRTVLSGHICAASMRIAGSDNYFCRSRSARVAHPLANSVVVGGRVVAGKDVSAGAPEARRRPS